jgi:Tfp pilus assembly protein FimT
MTLWGQSVCARQLHPRSLRASRKAGGFSILEMAVVLAIVMLGASIFFIALKPALQQVEVTSAVNTALATVRRAREAAVSQRTVYVVNFVPPNTIQVTEKTDTGTLLIATTLPADIIFVADPSLPNKAPDGFGTGKVAVDFAQNIPAGNKNELYFQPDGSATDINNNINNGVAYLGRAGDLGSSRALSVWGATGRVRAWKLNWDPSSTAYWGQQ